MATCAWYAVHVLKVTGKKFEQPEWLAKLEMSRISRRMMFKEVSQKQGDNGVDCIRLVLCRDLWWAVVSSVTILLLPSRAERLLLADRPVASQGSMFRRFTSLVLI
jgi:hypothetical protein